jgi:hypothetical protein
MCTTFPVYPFVYRTNSVYSLLLGPVQLVSLNLADGWPRDELPNALAADLEATSDSRPLIISRCFDLFLVVSRTRCGPDSELDSRA